MPRGLDHWQLKSFDPGAANQSIQASQTEDGWVETSAPGDTYLALIDAGRLDHPFKGRHETDAAWVRDKVWWWRTQFESGPPAAHGERVQLVFEGLDTFAAVYLDGELLGRTDNMFRRNAFDVTDRVQARKTHTLAICFSPTAEVIAGRETPVWAAFVDRVSVSKRNLIRKAQFGWGWDWGPDLPTVGVWKPVHLERHKGAAIAHLAFATLNASADRAEVRVGVELDRAEASANPRLEVTLTGPDGRPVASMSAPGAASVSLDFVIPEPHLWWSADLGDQPLYTLVVHLFDGDTPLDQRSRRVGVRTLTIDRSPDPDEPGSTFFRFVLNGAPLFAKGVCWVPTTSFVADVDAVRYRDLIERAAQANMNMIRIWGGGIYEPDLFYDLCDETGILVWQDFMFACAHYPQEDPVFVDSVKGEIADQVRRLRGHPSLAVWCGNNESQAMQFFAEHANPGETPLQGLIYYDEIMPDMLARLDPHTPYWPSSPYGGPSPNSMRGGDVHNWTVWHGIPPVPDKDAVGHNDRGPDGVAYTRYAEDNCRFVSEFGIQAAPSMTTLRRWMAPEDLALDSPGLLGRVKDAPDKANAMMSPVTGLPQSLEDYVDFSMWTQAEGMKFGIEHYRRRKPHCSGALIWQYNDCWPCVSWSLIDYDGVGKASLYATTRAFAPAMASFKPLEGDAFELWIVNDRLHPIAGQAVVALARMDEGADWTETVDYVVPANAAIAIWRGVAKDADDRALTVRSPSGAFPANRHLLAPIKRLAFKRGAKPAIAVEQTGSNALRVSLSADAYLAFVSLTSDRPDLRFCDNHFDLAAGETATVVVTASSPVAAADIQAGCWNSRDGGVR